MEKPQEQIIESEARTESVVDESPATRKDWIYFTLAFLIIVVLVTVVITLSN